MDETSGIEGPAFGELSCTENDRLYETEKCDQEGENGEVQGLHDRLTEVRKVSKFSTSECLEVESRPSKTQTVLVRQLIKGRGQVKYAVSKHTDDQIGL